MDIAEVERNFAELVEKVHREGITIDVECDNQVIARLIPPLLRPKLTLGEFVALMQSQPFLGDDAESFAKDVREVRTGFPPEVDPWD